MHVGQWHTAVHALQQVLALSQGQRLDLGVLSSLVGEVERSQGVGGGGVDGRQGGAAGEGSDGAEGGGPFPAAAAGHAAPAAEGAAAPAAPAAAPAGEGEEGEDMAQLVADLGCSVPRVLHPGVQQVLHHCVQHLGMRQVHLGSPHQPGTCPAAAQAAAPAAARAARVLEQAVGAALKQATAAAAGRSAVWETYALLFRCVVLLLGLGYCCWIYGTVAGYMVLLLSWVLPMS